MDEKLNMSREEMETLAEELLEYAALRDSHSRYVFDRFELCFPKNQSTAVVIHPYAAPIPIPITRAVECRSSQKAQAGWTNSQRK